MSDRTLIYIYILSWCVVLSLEGSFLTFEFWDKLFLKWFPSLVWKNNIPSFHNFSHPNLNGENNARSGRQHTILRFKSHHSIVSNVNELDPMVWLLERINRPCMLNCQVFYAKSKTKLKEKKNNKHLFLKIK